MSAALGVISVTVPPPATTPRALTSAAAIRVGRKSLLGPPEDQWTPSAKVRDLAAPLLHALQVQVRLLNHSPVPTGPLFPNWTLLPTVHSQVSSPWEPGGWVPSAVLLLPRDAPFPFSESLTLLC